ncbi:MAG: carbohydrate ABC transporter permease [Chloroflexi bacterium]|nr:carbohydrate ABC transporter permease [Chloroflexota bacterium]
MDHRMSRANQLLTYAMWLFLLVVFLFPIYWLVVSSFKTEGQQFAIPPIWFPAPATLENYIELFSDAKVINSLKNSLTIAGVTLAAVALLGIPAAYSMARFRVGGSLMMLVIFTARLLPPVAYIIPLFAIARGLNLYDRHESLVALYTFFALPLAIWMLVGFISAIPDEIEDAAMIDGASRIGVIWHVVLPLIRPGLASVTIFMLLTSWNEFPLAVTLTARKARTLPVTMYTFVTNQNIAWGELAAAGVLSATPIVIAGLLVQKHLVMGLVTGSGK